MAFGLFGGGENIGFTSVHDDAMRQMQWGMKNYTLATSDSLWPLINVMQSFFGISMPIVFAVWIPVALSDLKSKFDGSDTTVLFHLIAFTGLLISICFLFWNVRFQFFG